MSKDHAEQLKEIETRLAEQDATWNQITLQAEALGDCRIHLPEAELHCLEELCGEHVPTPFNLGGLRA